MVCTIDFLKFSFSSLSCCFFSVRGAMLSRESQMNLSLTLSKVSAFTGRRLEVFKVVASTSKALSIDRERADGWPLWLPATHRLLVSSNIASEKETVEPEADRFIVDGALASFKYVLSHLEILLPLVPTIPNAILADPEIPLSLQDSQLYLGALVRLPEDQRSDALLSLARGVSCALTKIKDSPESMELVRKNRVVTGFLARLVTTCTYAAVFSRCEEYVRHQVLQMLKCVSFWSPSFRRVREGFHVQSHFMGVLSDRESSLLPQMTTLPTCISSETATELRHFLELAFHVGLRASSDDSGFLMFSAWNAIGKMCVWDPATKSPFVSEMSIDSIPNALLVLRERVCLVHQQIQAVDGKYNATTVARAYNAKFGKIANGRALAENLHLLISSCSSMVEALLSSDHKNQKAQLGGDAFVLLEGVSGGRKDEFTTVCFPFTSDHVFYNAALRHSFICDIVTDQTKTQFS